MKKILFTFLIGVAFQFSFGQWSTNGTNVYYNGGQVGIGTSSPNTYWGKVLQVYDANNAALSVKTPQADWQLVTDASGGLHFRNIAGGGNLGALFVASNGNVGIGTTSPAGALEVVKGSTRIQMAANNTGLGDIFRIFGLNGSAFAVNSYLPGSGKLITDLGINYAIDGGNGAIPYALIGTKKAPVFRLNAEDGSIALYGDNGTGTDYRTPAFNLGLFVQGDGKIGIGTNNTQGYQLAVNGDAIFTKVKVKQYSSWPDYVFHQSYKLPSLNEVNEYIKRNNHLPDVPSAKEVETNGLDLAENQALLLKKIEELTLYIIEQDKKSKEQDKKIESQQRQINELLEMKKYRNTESKKSKQLK